ncbi:Rieske 2Fe-2S domain-containing protein [Demetria terragena]|uniref:Rieske 2Fe-2S domain-containing protein n=1 Tax=Demetria terragena TaxID=63959 RepID=UPI00037670E9|nr:Rieske 2Fe-2S domain-containing protein [Demetria terragena]
MTATHAGWYLAAFTDEITSDLTPLRIGDRRIMVIRTEVDGGPVYRVTDSTCPHRGANLAQGGEVRGDCVVCPFHGRLIATSNHPKRASVNAYETLHIGPLLFVRFADGEPGDCGFPAALRTMTEGSVILPAVNELVDVPCEFVVENAFDVEHFSPVHSVPNLDGMVTSAQPDGTLVIGGDFVTMTDPWYDQRFAEAARAYLAGGDWKPSRRSAFRAVAFSPTVVATSFGSEDNPPVILTAATPEPGGTRVRVSVIGKDSPALPHIVNGSKVAIAQDTEVWAHLDHDAPWALDDADVNVVAYRAWIDRFPSLVAPRSAPVP